MNLSFWAGGPMALKMGLLENYVRKSKRLQARKQDSYDFAELASIEAETERLSDEFLATLNAMRWYLF